MQNFVQNAAAGRRYFCRYGGDDLWHERFVVGLTAVDPSYLGLFVVSPDGDCYFEEAEDYDGLPHWAGERGGRPATLDGCRLYRFGAGDLVPGSQFRQEALEIFDAAVRDGEVALPGGQAAAGPLAPGGVIVGAGMPQVQQVQQQPQQQGPILPLGFAYGAVGTTWLVCEDVIGVKAGGTIDQQATDTVVFAGSRGVLLRGGATVNVAAVGTWAPPALSDVRTLPVQYTAKGDRMRSFGSAADLLTTSDYTDFPIAGPRTTQWLAENVVSSGHTPTQRHYWWRQVLNAQVTEPGIEEHLHCCQLLEYATTYDQINIGELAWAEAVARKLQLWEERYAERLRNRCDGGTNSGFAQERQLFMGSARASGPSLIMPELAKWVADSLSSEAAVLKERRKGREERAQAAAAGGGGPEGKKKKGPKGDGKGSDG